VGNFSEQLWGVSDERRHRFDTLEARLSQVAQRLEQTGRHISEAQFAALLDYIGDSDVRVRIEQLDKAFPP
jgi:hypothetical protein